MTATRISVVVPLYNEEESVPPLVTAVRDALGPGSDWELVLVDDGSRDRTAEVAGQAAASDPRVRLLRLARNCGQTPAMQAGFDHARGDVVVSMDGDLQNDPADIPRLVGRLEEGYDLVAGYRERRQDTVITRKIPSWIANRIIRRLTGVQIRDNGCSLKAYRREVLARMHLYSDMHRFIPAVAAATAGARITELPVRHHARRFGQSKYGLSRIAKVLADLLTIKMIRSFRERPLRLFAIGSLGAALLGFGFTMAALVAAAWFRPEKVSAVVFPGAALLWFELAGYLLLLGLIAETAVIEHRRDGAEQAPLARGDLQ
ncbi:MAG: glycosyltransferase family 2 protein [Gemmatimonadota bacterium]|nr:glycosyltransferase family 2 protein [Gemmatimonadota bacterium]MDH5283246.1 glycosyltransferase family 2 protein [Gemmatimonadota bacterium]